VLSWSLDLLARPASVAAVETPEALFDAQEEKSSGHVRAESQPGLAERLCDSFSRRSEFWPVIPVVAVRR